LIDTPASADLTRAAAGIPARSRDLVDLAGETTQRPPLRIGERRRPLPVKLGQHAALPQHPRAVRRPAPNP
jgi:hypothetical protein